MSDMLEKSILLGELGSDERATLFEFLEAREIEEGVALFRAGDESGDLYLIIQGSVRLELDGRDAGQVGAGDALGAMSLVCMGTRRCAAVAAEVCRVLVLSRADYLRLRGDCPSIALALQEGIVRHVSSELQPLLERA